MDSNTATSDSGKNPYDMRSMCKYGRLCYDFDMIGTYLNKPDVQSELRGLSGGCLRSMRS
jgi:hypothetical protein